MLAMSAEHHTLDLLPDDVLVLVMQRLSVDDLLACRLVCRRLGGLALHPEVWRHRRLDDDHRKPCVCAVLSLAPCLDRVVYREEFSSRMHTRAFATTTCAVRHLALHVRLDADCKRACLAVRNQHALGRLRSVELETHYPIACIRAYVSCRELLKTLMECFGLESLDVLNRLSCAYAVRLLVNGPSGSCVNFFRSALSEYDETSINIVLAGLAATLEEVDLGSTYASSADTAALLAGMPRLRKLNCEVFPGMEALAACKTLVDLSIVAVDRLMDSGGDGYVDRDALNGAATLLRQADELRTVSIDLYENCFADTDLKILMQTLTSSPRPLVKRLSVTYTYYDMEPLLRALPQLPALRELSLWGTVLFQSYYDDAMDAFLLALTPTTTTPALRLLELSAYESEGCVHRWLHRDSVKSVLTANPQLHIRVPAPDECGRCDHCAARCHRQVTWGISVRRGLGLCEHDPDQCPSPKDHTPSFVWIRITTE